MTHQRAAFVPPLGRQPNLLTQADVGELLQMSDDEFTALDDMEAGFSDDLVAHVAPHVSHEDSLTEHDEQQGSDIWGEGLPGIEQLLKLDRAEVEELEGMVADSQVVDTAVVNEATIGDEGLEDQSSGDDDAESIAASGAASEIDQRDVASELARCGLADDGADGRAAFCFREIATGKKASH